MAEEEQQAQIPSEEFPEQDKAEKLEKKNFSLKGTV